MNKISSDFQEKSLCVFCGASLGKELHYKEWAQGLGPWLKSRGYNLIYGGGHTGLMGVIADSALAAGVKVIGVIPQALMDREKAHAKLSELHVVKTMHERKALMAAKADGFLTLPGGFGTLDELNEIVTWAQLGIHNKPIAVMKKFGFFDHFYRFVEYATGEGFIAPEFLSRIQWIDDWDEFDEEKV